MKVLLKSTKNVKDMQVLFVLVRGSEEVTEFSEKLPFSINIGFF